ncbi:B12-binding domain-containing protein [uncultured Thiodictyon sp.]|uniref:B12-binding domain-containing protein n=1 Tax=uncultured Thiodictyon sp. TaxID=1846217 RepID=UPI0025EC51C5|nr:B12-binding domain-containing protein [uncultured Thiodictyon sp.]
MANDKDQLFERLADAVLELDEELTKQLAHEVLARGYDAWDAIENGLLLGIGKAGKLFDEGVVSPNPRKFRQPKSSPATIASRSRIRPAPRNV